MYLKIETEVAKIRRLLPAIIYNVTSYRIDIKDEVLVIWFKLMFKALIYVFVNLYLI